MRPDELESSEFYTRRWRNFPTLLIWPITLLIVLSCIFAFFAKKQLMIRATGQITAIKPLNVIQSTSSNAISIINLQEGQRVKKGDSLIRYQDGNTDVQIKLLKVQKHNMQQRLKAIDLLIQGEQTNSDTFSEADEFGYSNLLRDYLNRRASTQAEANIANKRVADDNVTEEKTTNTINSLLNQYKAKISDVNIAISAIENGKSVDKSNENYNIYETYVSQSKDVGGDNSSTLRNQTILTLQQQRETYQSTLDNYLLQQAGETGAKDPTQVQAQGTASLEDLQQSSLASEEKEQANLAESLETIKAKLSVYQTQNEDNVLKARETGVVHREANFSNVKYCPRGTVIGEIFPELKKSKEIGVEAFVSGADAANLKVGEKVTFHLPAHAPKQLSISGRIKSIDSAATQSKNGNAFRVLSDVSVQKDQQKDLRYNLQGPVYFVTGEKTYFDYYKDRLLNQSD